MKSTSSYPKKRNTIRYLVLHLSIVFFLLSNTYLTFTAALSKDKAEWCSSFILAEEKECTDEDWIGVLKDMFSPDDTCPNSTRYIDGIHKAVPKGLRFILEVSASGTEEPDCDTTWGRRFNKTTTVNPIISKVRGQSPCVRTTSFMSKVMPGDPLYDNAQNGALNFTLWLGSVNCSKVNKWNGVYNGKGGDMAGTYVPPSDCDNFWLYF